MSNQFTITIANRQHATYSVKAHQPLLSALNEQGLDLPYGCKYGGCITCAAKYISGTIEQSNQKALNKKQLDAGYVLLCIARATSDCVIEIGVDSHDALYSNPFLQNAKWVENLYGKE